MYAKRVFLMLLALLAVAGLAACGGSDDGEGSNSGGKGSTSSKAATDGGASVPVIVIENGEPSGGVQGLEYSAGEQVRFEVRSDVADEIHVHGYDLMKDVPAGGTVSFSFPAEIEGIFEVELEDRKEQIAELRVNP
jgi:hypothetical protein